MEYQMDNMGKYITDISLQKVSSRFKYDQMLDDSECSEDYNDDMFFEVIQQKQIEEAQEIKD